jgi:peptide-methionine (S)-S-oxide reductase
MTSLAARRVSAIALVLIGAGLLINLNRARAKSNVVFPDPVMDDATAASSGRQTAVFAGGCFWGLQLVFEHVKGVVQVTAGYSGGSPKTAEYERVCTGRTGHAESVKIVFDPSQITFGRLLKVFFAIAHNPTELNRQGPDEGTQYRSAIFYADEHQRQVADAYIRQLNEARIFRHNIVTQLVPLQGFYPAEPYHQDYAIRNPRDPYIDANDLPKLDNLRKHFPDLCAGKR